MTFHIRHQDYLYECSSTDTSPLSITQYPNTNCDGVDMMWENLDGELRGKILRKYKSEVKKLNKGKV